MNLQRSAHLVQAFEDDSKSESVDNENENELAEELGDLQLDPLEDGWRKEAELGLGKKGEDGLYLYQQLSETFERELTEFSIYQLTHAVVPLLKSLAAEQLSSRDQDILRAYAYKVKARLMREAFTMLPFTFDGIIDSSKDEVDSHAAFLSGLDPVLYDCCPQSCCCYVSPHQDCKVCPYCGKA